MKREITKAVAELFDGFIAEIMEVYDDEVERYSGVAGLGRVITVTLVPEEFNVANFKGSGAPLLRADVMVEMPRLGQLVVLSRVAVLCEQSAVTKNVREYIGALRMNNQDDATINESHFVGVVNELGKRGFVTPELKKPEIDRSKVLYTVTLLRESDIHRATAATVESFKERYFEALASAVSSGLDAAGSVVPSTVPFAELLAEGEEGFLQQVEAVATCLNEDEWMLKIIDETDYSACSGNVVLKWAFERDYDVTLADAKVRRSLVVYEMFEKIKAQAPKFSDPLPLTSGGKLKTRRKPSPSKMKGS